MEKEHCNQCKNQCAIDELRCNKGRIHFGLEPVEEKMPAGALGLLQKCGFVLHHGSMEPEEALSVLTNEEQAELERLLSVLLKDWEKRMPQKQSKHQHGHH